MPQNLFETGGDSQYQLLLPYIKNIKGYQIDDGLIIEFIDYFISQVKSAAVVREEREVLPSWVVDRKDYVMKSEILICATLFSAFLESKNLIFKSEGPSEETEEIEGIEVPKFTSSQPAIIYKLYDAIRKLGQERNWDLGILHFQILKTFGGHFKTLFGGLIIPVKLQNKDYN
jgi:hypothetical protein